MESAAAIAATVPEPSTPEVSGKVDEGLVAEATPSTMARDDRVPDPVEVCSPNVNRPSAPGEEVTAQNSLDPPKLPEEEGNSISVEAEKATLEFYPKDDIGKIPLENSSVVAAEQLLNRSSVAECETSTFKEGTARTVDSKTDMESLGADCNADYKADKLESTTLSCEGSNEHLRKGASSNVSLTVDAEVSPNSMANYRGIEENVDETAPEVGSKGLMDKVQAEKDTPAPLDSNEEPAASPVQLIPPEGSVNVAADAASGEDAPSAAIQKPDVLQAPNSFEESTIADDQKQESAEQMALETRAPTHQSTPLESNEPGNNRHDEMVMGLASANIAVAAADAALRNLAANDDSIIVSRTDITGTAAVTDDVLTGDKNEREHVDTILSMERANDEEQGDAAGQDGTQEDGARQDGVKPKRRVLKKKIKSPPKTVFESKPVPSTATASALAASAPRAQQKTVYEKNAAPSCADAVFGRLPDAKPQTKTVFENAPQPSMATARTLGCAPQRSQTKTVFENTPQRSCAHTGTLVAPEHKMPAKTIYENKVAESAAHARWNAPKNVEQKRTEYMNNPAPSKAAIRWDAPAQQPAVVKTVFVNQPKPTKVHASAIRDLTDSEYTYTTEEEDEDDQPKEAINATTE